MQDGELALLHRSLAKPAEMDTSHPSLTQANTLSSLIHTCASWVLPEACCDIKNIASSRDDSTCPELSQMAQCPSLRNSESAQVREHCLGVPVIPVFSRARLHNVPFLKGRKGLPKSNLTDFLNFYF